MNATVPTLQARPASESQTYEQPTRTSVTLTGMLQRRGQGLYLEQEMDQPQANGRGWSIPRIYRLMATPATQDAVQRLIDSSVTVTGNPDDIDVHGAKCVVLTSVESSERAPVAV